MGRGTERGQATVFGKGGKTCVVMLYGRAWGLLQIAHATACKLLLQVRQEGVVLLRFRRHRTIRVCSRLVPIDKGKPPSLGFPFFRVRGDLALH